MSTKKTQKSTIVGSNNIVKQKIINNYPAPATNDPSEIERVILLRKIDEFESCLSDFKEALQPPQDSGTPP